MGKVLFCFWNNDSPEHCYAMLAEEIERDESKKLSQRLTVGILTNDSRGIGSFPYGLLQVTIWKGLPNSRAARFSFLNTKPKKKKIYLLLVWLIKAWGSEYYIIWSGGRCRIYLFSLHSSLLTSTVLPFLINISSLLQPLTSFPLLHFRHPSHLIIPSPPSCPVFLLHSIAAPLILYWVLLSFPQ